MMLFLAPPNFKDDIRPHVAVEVILFTSNHFCVTAAIRVVEILYIDKYMNFLFCRHFDLLAGFISGS